VVSLRHPKLYQGSKTGIQTCYRYRLVERGTVTESNDRSQETPHPPRAEDFDAMYAGTPPWDIGRPQPAFLQLAEAGALKGRLLDVGCGTGEHALMAAGLGLPATGIDAAPSAIALAEGKARDRQLTVRFLVGDALELGALGEQFDSVLDCGMFHIFDDDDRSRFVDSLRAAIPAGGRYFMLCFSDRQPGEWGPRRVTEAEIRASFAEGWNVDAIEAARIDITIDPEGAQAWLVALTRRVRS
jgi:SAM-dependent methyltransferase